MKLLVSFGASQVLSGTCVFFLTPELKGFACHVHDNARDYMFGVYLFWVSLRLNTALIANPNSSSGNLLANIAVGLGVIGYSIMALEFALIARIKAAAQPFGEDALQLFHNWMGTFALFLILVHPILVGFFGYPTSGHSTQAIASIGFASVAQLA